MKKLSLLLIISSCAVFLVNGQNNSRNYQIRTLAFYNLENLFDTINDPEKDDEQSPIMKFKGNKSTVYWEKINRMGFAISQIGLEKSKTVPSILGVAEIENRNVLEDLVRSQPLASKNYGIIHYDSPDKRGIDVALLYRQDHFNPIHHEVISPNIYRNNHRIYTRDILYVSGYLDNELIHILVNHWPSRSGGIYKTNPSREKAAYVVKNYIQKIRSTETNAKIFVMGDFNDDPINSSFTKILETKKEKNTLKLDDLFNPYEKMFQKGLYTLGHRNNINLFDMILLSESLIPKQKNAFESYQLYYAGIFSESFLITSGGRYKGFPFRSFSNGNFTKGYSDHFPVYVYLIKKQP